MLQRCVLYYHLTWLTSPPIWWDSIERWYDHQMKNKVSHKLSCGRQWMYNGLYLCSIEEAVDGISWWWLVFILELNG